VLNACETEVLGETLRQAGVPVVICWRTKVEDNAGRIFATTLYDACAQGCTERVAFDRAVQALRLVLRQCTLTNGMAAKCRKYEIRAPEQPAHSSGFEPLPWGAGVPVLLSAEGTVVPDIP